MYSDSEEHCHNFIVIHLNGVHHRPFKMFKGELAALVEAPYETGVISTIPGVEKGVARECNRANLEDDRIVKVGQLGIF